VNSNPAISLGHSGNQHKLQFHHIFAKALLTVMFPLQGAKSYRVIMSPPVGLTHHVVVIEILADSYRLNASLNRKKKPEP